MTSIHTQEHVRSEFPDYPLASLPELPDSWKSRSWRNDEFPMFEAATHFVGVDYPDEEGDRFFVYAFDGFFEGHAQIGDCVLETNDWAAVLDFTGCPDDARLERLRSNALTVDDARRFLADEEQAGKPCPDFMAFLRQLIANEEARAAELPHGVDRDEALGCAEDLRAVLVKRESCHYHGGIAAKAAGQPRALPSYYTKPTSNSADWLRGWDDGETESGQ